MQCQCIVISVNASNVVKTSRISWQVVTQADKNVGIDSSVMDPSWAKETEEEYLGVARAESVRLPPKLDGSIMFNTFAK